jgi:hypothetical protein
MSLHSLIAMAPRLLAADPDPTSGVDFTRVDKATLDAFNPLIIENSTALEELSRPSGVISRLMTYIFPIAGLGLFVILVISGFEIMMAAASKKSIDAGKQRATAAVIGFMLLFASYWIAQIIEIIFGIKILGT